MQVKFHGQHTTEEAMENLVSILQLFKERYGVEDFRSIHLDLVLLNEQGEDMELIDGTTAEVLDILEVYKSQPVANMEPESSSKELAHLRLVVDNTRKK